MTSRTSILGQEKLFLHEWHHVPENETQSKSQAPWILNRNRVERFSYESFIFPGRLLDSPLPPKYTPPL